MQVTNGDLIMADGFPVGGVLVGANYTPLGKTLINRVARLDQVMGTLGSSDEVKDAFRTALSANSPEEMIVRQIRAAEADGNDERVAKLKSELRAYIGDDDRVTSLMAGYNSEAFAGESKATRRAFSLAAAASEKTNDVGIGLEVGKKALDAYRTTDAIGLPSLPTWVRQWHEAQLL